MLDALLGRKLKDGEVEGAGRGTLEGRGPGMLDELLGPSLSCWSLQNAEHWIPLTFLASLEALPSAPLFPQAVACSCEALPSAPRFLQAAAASTVVHQMG